MPPGRIPAARTPRQIPAPRGDQPAVIRVDRGTTASGPGDETDMSEPALRGGHEMKDGMSDANETGERTIRRAGRKPLGLKPTGDSGTATQSLSGRKTRTVQVEVVKKRVRRRSPGGEDAAAEAPARAAEAAPKAEKPAAEQKDKTQEPAATGAVLPTLTPEERDKRAAALADAKVREREDKIRRAEEEKKRKEEEARRAREAEERRIAEEEAARLLDAETSARRKKAAPEPQEAEPVAAKPAPAGRAKSVAEEDDEETKSRAKRGKAEAPKPARAPKGEARRRTGKLTITRALDDGDERMRSLASFRRQRERERRKSAGGGSQAPQKVVREVVIPEVITVQELASRMAIRAVDVIKTLMQQGIMATINDVIDSDMAQLIAEEHGHTVKRISESDVEEGLVGEQDPPGSLQPRAPVVTVMGHVDHGKTSLLDALRRSNVATGEAGGITQHIGAYQVVLESGQKITFLDTPGHAAFTAMRARGAKATDIVVLVVAADDGVMPQTIEAINHARAAEVPIIVAINKCDKPDANPDRVRQDLLQHNIIVESLGGDIQDVEVSALKRIGLDKLQDAILLQAEIMELKANPDRPGEGVVIEAKLDKGRGPVGTVLIQRGVLKVGDIFVAGAEWGRVRALINDRGENVESAGPTVPVEVLGFQGTPEAGDLFHVVENEARAREVADFRQRKRREARVAGTGGRGSLEQMLAQLREQDKKEFPVLIKGDVQGSVEAIVGALNQLSTDEVAARPIHAAVGGITESDVILASASGAPIIAFNVRANAQAREHAQRDGIEIRYYSVIYDLIDDVKKAMEGLLSPAIRETFLGNAEILEVFNITKVGKVAGCRVSEGNVKRGARVRLIRDNVVIHEGKLSTLKRFKDEVKEVHAGQECGMAFENYQDIQKGDVIECFEVEEVARTL
jgi:translation initiation factor IF-2